MWLQKSPNGGGALLLSSNCKITLKIGQKPLSSPTEWVVTAKATTTPKHMQPSLTSQPPAAFETEKSKPTAGDRKRVGEGKSVQVRLNLGCRRLIKKKKK